MVGKAYGTERGDGAQIFLPMAGFKSAVTRLSGSPEQRSNVTKLRIKINGSNQRTVFPYGCNTKCSRGAYELQ
jgi:hypothetical protein